MKKLFIALMACAVMVSCSKSDITYDDQPQEIGLAPFAKKNTKAAVDGTDYPNDLHMYIFANAGTAETADASYTEVYFKNATFANKNNGVFGGYPNPYYWPNVKKLIFSGVSASGNVNATTTGSVPQYSYNATDSKWQIALTGYTPGQGTTTAGDNDLMWFPTTIPYTKATGTADDGDVDVTMLHACSWITIKIKGDDITGAANTTWKILGLTVGNMATTGDVVLTDTAAWTELTATSDVIVHENTTGTALTTNEVDYTKLATNGAKYNDFIIIPQATKELTIKYSYVSQEGATDTDDIVITEEKSVSLAFNGTDEWQPGVHYTYTITIGTNEILIEPVAYDWTEHENGKKPTVTL